jgi:hypothetical protein
LKESDLYLPLKRFLESQNIKVKGEVQDWDALAVRGQETPVVVELKLSLNLDVVLQAVDRQALTPKVYIGIPKQCKILNRRRRHIIKLLLPGRSKAQKPGISCTETCTDGLTGCPLGCTNSLLEESKRFLVSGKLLIKKTEDKLAGG